MSDLMSKEFISELQLLGSVVFFGSSLAFQKAAMINGIRPYTYQACRYVISLAVTLVFRSEIICSSNMPKMDSDDKVTRGRSVLFFYGIIGGLVQFLGCILQQIGLITVSTARGGFITGMYVVFVPVVEWLIALLSIYVGCTCCYRLYDFFTNGYSGDGRNSSISSNSRSSINDYGGTSSYNSNNSSISNSSSQKDDSMANAPSSSLSSITVGTWIAVLVSFLGLYLLSGCWELVGEGCLGGAMGFGDLMVFIGMFFWAASILISDKACKLCDILDLVSIEFAVTLLCSLMCALLLEPDMWQLFPTDGTVAFKQIRENWLQIWLVGLFETTAFILGCLGQMHTSAPRAALLYSLESVMAALCGAVILGETLNINQTMGCCMMFSAAAYSSFSTAAKEIVVEGSV